MLSKKLLKSYDCEFDSDYFDIVIESRINGNISQAVEQFKKIEKSKRSDFFDYVKSTSNDYVYEFFLNLVISS